jgi:hypothetical protein
MFDCSLILCTSQPVANAADDLYSRLKELESQIEFLDIQEEYVKTELKNLKRELIRSKQEIQRIRATPLVIGTLYLFSTFVLMFHHLIVSVLGFRSIRRDGGRHQRHCPIDQRQHFVCSRFVHARSRATEAERVGGASSSLVGRRRNSAA